MARGVQQRKLVSSTVGSRGRQKVSQKSRGQRSRPSVWRTLGWIAAFSGVSLVSAFAGMTFVLMSPFQGTNHRGQRDPLLAGNDDTGIPIWHESASEPLGIGGG